MNASKIVCTLLQAQQLKALGIKQMANFYWKEMPITGKWIAIPFTSSTLDLETDIAAYCDSELAVMLDAFYETSIESNDKWNGGNLNDEDSTTPAQASAARLIHLLKKDERLTVEMANERLFNFYK